MAVNSKRIGEGIGGASTLEAAPCLHPVKKRSGWTFEGTLGPMSESRKRADVSSRATAPDAWDAGLHAESEAGPIAVGLSVEPGAVGLIIDAPGIGLLKLAFDLQGDGTTRLSRASRRLSDGRDALLVAIDESKVLQLEGELNRLRKTHDEVAGTLTTERDEARDRAAIVSEDRTELSAELKATKAQVSSLTADLLSEKEQRLVNLAEREKAREELKGLSRELVAARAALEERGDDADESLSKIAALEARLRAAQGKQAELEAAAAELEPARAKLAEVETHLAEAQATAAELEQTRSKLTQLETQVQSLAAELDEARSGLSEAQVRLASQSQLSAERDDARARIAALDDAVKQETEARELALATERHERTRLAAELEDVRTELQTARSALGISEETIASLRANTTQEAELETLRATAAQLTIELQTAHEAGVRLEGEKGTSADELATANEARIRLESELEALRASTAELNEVQERLESELDARRAASADAAELQAQLIADLEIATAARAQLEAELGRAKMSTTLAPELEAARNTAATLEAELARREEALSMATARAEAIQSQLAAAEARMGAESSATREARDVALKLKAHADKLMAERDEARGLARQLHVKLAAPKQGETDLRVALDAERQVAANLVSERDQLNLRLEALGRMLDQERDSRARALAERDEWQLRFKALAKGNTDVSEPLDLSREETRSYFIERATMPDMPAAKAEAITDPAVPKKKGP